MASPDRNFANSAIFTQTASGTIPNAGDNSLYFKSDNNIYSKNSSGVETQITPADFANYLASIGQSSTLIETVERNVTFTSASATSGTMYFSMLTPVVNTTISKLAINVVAAATGTPTLFRMGVYSYNEATNTATLLASTANVTSAITSVQIAELTISSITLIAGMRYAFAFLGVGFTTAPSFSSITVPVNLNQTAPLIIKTQGGLTDLPSTVVPSGNTSTSKFWLRGS